MRSIISFGQSEPPLEGLSVTLNYNKLKGILLRDADDTLR